MVEFTAVVLDKNTAQPIAGASVKFFIFTEITDSHGRAFFGYALAKAGETVDVVVDAPGYDLHVEKVTLRDFDFARNIFVPAPAFVCAEGDYKVEGDTLLKCIGNKWVFQQVCEYGPAPDGKSCALPPPPVEPEEKSFIDAVIGALKNAVDLLADFLKLPSPSRNSAIDKLMSMAQPKLEAWLYDLALETARRSGIVGLEDMLKRAPEASPAPPILVILGFLAAVQGFGFTVSWAAKEMAEPAGFGVWAAIDVGEWEAGKKALPVYRLLIDKAAGVIGTIGWLSPFTKGIFDGWVRSARAQADTFESVIEANLPVVTKMVINSSPSGANLEIEELALTTATPFEREVEPGSYSLKLSKEGYESQEAVVEVFKGTTATRNFILQKIPSPEKASLEVVTNQDFTEIYLNGVFQRSARSYLFQGLEPGTYSVSVSKTGFRTLPPQMVELTPGGLGRAEFFLEEMPKPPAGTGIVDILTSPGNVDAYEGANHLGTTDDFGRLSIEMVPGSHDIIFRKEGYQERVKTVIVRENEHTTVSVVLSLVPATRKLWRVDVSAADPDGNPLAAKILVNGSFTGKWTTDYVILNPGTYIFRLEKSGFLPAEREIELEPIE